MKSFRIMQIGASSGILMWTFVFACLVAGFIVFPSYLSMSVWNYIAQYFDIIPPIGIAQGLFLWIIIIMAYGTLKASYFFVNLTPSLTFMEKDFENIKDLKIHSIALSIKRTENDTNEKLVHKNVEEEVELISKK